MKAFQSILLTLFLGMLCFTGVSAQAPKASPPGPFRFISFGDAQGIAIRLATTAKLAATFDPAFLLFNGDLQDVGSEPAGLAEMTNALGSLFDKVFLVRGNHDNALVGSAKSWNDYFSAIPRPLPAGVTNYTALDASTSYLTYSFDYGNSRFIGLDVPGDVQIITDGELQFLEDRLADAESKGLRHAFLFFHGPGYCVEAIHCTCQDRTDAACTPTALIEILNRHPIVSATFHGHDHVLGWVHLNQTRLAGLKQPYEQFLTSPAGGFTYNAQIYPERMDYFYKGVADVRGFAVVDVNGASFTVRLYDVASAQPVWVKVFPVRNRPARQQFFGLVVSSLKEE